MQDNHLITEINALAPDEQAEVVDFIQRLKAKKSKPPALSEPLESRTPTSDGEEGQFKRKFGCMQGLVKYMADDFDAPLEDFAEYM
jgi:hypothetical protein